MPLEVGVTVSELQELGIREKSVVLTGTGTDFPLILGAQLWRVPPWDY